MRWPIPATVAAILGLGSLAFALRSESPGKSKAASGPAAKSGPLLVTTHTVQVAPFAVNLPATGTLFARESVELVSELSRRLVRVPVDEGQSVKKGELLFELDSADLVAQIAKLDVQIQLNRATLARSEKLVAEGVSATSDLELAQANLDSLVAERRVLGVTLSKTQIRAPFAGVLGLRRVSLGAWVSPSTVLATLQDISSLKLDFALPERYAGLLAVGAEFSFKVAGQGQPFSAKVSALDPVVDTKTRSILVRGVVEGQPGLFAGAFANVEVPIRVEQALFVPAMAVMPGALGRQVFVVEGTQATARLIEIGERTADRVQVLSGLAAGDRVIVSHLLRLQNGSTVRVGEGK
ncbi:MAG: efflux RND transporter periplasmic adaptor subunit [Polyangiaceae bacterium]|nr:efflux RND transporter periplasmic adaptor subunit [Polyangiaceae bacterium]